MTAACTHALGSLICDRTTEHPGHGDGCTHTAAWLADGRHDDEGVQE
jgi:hypothetical protein